MSKHKRTHACPCGADIPASTWLCDACVDDLADILADVDTLSRALEDAYLRQQRFSVARVAVMSRPNPDDGRQEESPLPFNGEAHELRRALARELRTIADRLPRVAIPVTIGGVADHIADQLPVLRTRPEAVETLATMRRLRRRIIECVDRPPDLVYLGRCAIKGCDADLYAEWGQSLTMCPACGYQHDVARRRDILLAALHDQIATASDIARGLSALDLKVTPERIRQWKHRGQIAERTPFRLGTTNIPRYRVGDVIDALLAEQKGKP